MPAVIAAVIPIILAIACGVAARRFGVLDQAAAARLNALVYWCLFPCLLVARLGAGRPPGTEALPFPWLALAVVVAVVVVSAALLSWWGRRFGPAAAGSLTTVAFRANAAFVGLPVVELLAANDIIPAEAVRTYLLLFTGVVPVFNVVSVISFLAPHHGVRARALVLIGRGLLVNPILWGCAVGIALSTWDGHMGGWWRGTVIEQTLLLIGSPAVALALIAAGASLQLRELWSVPMPVWVSVFWKLAVMPAAVYGVAVVVGIPPALIAILTTMMICPTAVASVPMAAALGGDVRLAASGVVVTTVCAPLTMILWLGFLLG